MPATARRPVTGPAAGWDGRELDLDAYLARIGHHGPVRPDANTLVALHRGHVGAIPFENLDVMLGRGISIDLPAVQGKLVHRRRGGYCYEMNLLFAAALDRIGIPVRRQLVRVGDPLPNPRPRPRSHLLLIAEAGGRRWLADVGFASGLLEPLPLDRPGQFTQDSWTYRLTGDGAGGGPRVQEWRADRWQTMYPLIEDETTPVDIAAANRYSSTHPDSPFVQRPTVIHRHRDHERRLVGRAFTVRGPEQGTTTLTVPDARYAGHLADQFGLRLTDAETARLVASIPDAADQP